MTGNNTALVMKTCPSPNFGERRDGVVPSIIVIHYTGTQDAAEALAWYQNEIGDPAIGEISAHYMIDRGGEIYAMVPEDKRAWHAGKSEWQGVDDVNSHSIGIELVNTGEEPFPQAQMDGLVALCRDIMARHDIKWVLGHEDVAPGRKADPGPLFDWVCLAASGVPNIHEKT